MAELSLFRSPYSQSRFSGSGNTDLSAGFKTQKTEKNALHPGVRGRVWRYRLNMSERKEEKRCSLFLTEKQLQVITDALESYFRVRSKEFGGLADDLAFANIDRDSVEDSIFEACIVRRDHAQDLFEEAGETALPWQMKEARQKTEACCIAEDLWAAIRYELYSASTPEKDRDPADERSHAPALISEEPMAELSWPDHF